MSKHLIIIGGGSAASTAARAVIARGGKATLIHSGLPLGGCCLHVGCVPSKYLIRAAEQVHLCQQSVFPGLRPRGVNVEASLLFSDLQRVIRELRERNYTLPLPRLKGLELIEGRGKILGPDRVEVNGRRINGDALLIATGSQTDMSGTESLPPESVLSNENLFQQDSLPASLLLIGGGYIAVELSQMLNRLGVRVTTLQRSPHLLSSQPAYLGEGLGHILQEEGVNLVCNVRLTGLEAGGDGVIVRAAVNGAPSTFTAQKVLMARGRTANTGDLGLENAGIPLRQGGFVDVNDRMQTCCPSVYAAGDVLGGHMLVYTASAEAERAVADLFGDPPRPWATESVPWVVFSDPQIAGVGLSEEQALERGLPVECAELPVSRWPRFSTVNRTRGFLKLFRDPRTDTLIGARALCPEAGDLMSELNLILRHQLPLRDIASSLVPYLTLSEGIQRCAGGFYP